MLWLFMCILLVLCQVSYSTIPDLLDYGAGVCGAVGKKYDCKLADDNADGLNV